MHTSQSSIFLSFPTPLRKGVALAVLGVVTGLLLIEAGYRLKSEVYRLDAVEALEEKDYKKALKSLSTAVALDTDNPGLYLMLGDVCLSLARQPQALPGFLEKSRKNYLAAAEKNPLLARTWFALARSEKINDYYKRAMSLDPNNVFYMLGYFSFLLRGKRYDEAKTVFSSAYEKAPALIDDHYLKKASKNKVFNKIVEEVFWEKIERTPPNLHLYYSLGNWYVVQGLFAHATGVYRKGIFAEETSQENGEKKWSPLLEYQIRRAEKFIKYRERRRRK